MDASPRQGGLWAEFRERCRSAVWIGSVLMICLASSAAGQELRDAAAGASGAQSPLIDPVKAACDAELSQLGTTEWTPATWSARAGGGWCGSRFAELDQDRNGTLTPAEARHGLGVLFGIHDAAGVALRRDKGLVFNWRTLVLEPDLNRDGRLTREEILGKLTGTPEEKEARFKANDRDADGVLSMAELTGGDAAQWADVPAKFAGWDQDHDGGLSADEIARSAKSWESAYAGWMFPAFDDDGDGRLTLGEFLATPFANQLLNWTGVRSDRDHDGRLSLDEFHPEPEGRFLGVSKLFFDRLDRNDDGALDLREATYRIDASRVPAEVVFQMLDRDQDGALGLADLFPPLSPDAPAGPVLPRHQAVFTQADQDGNGALTSAELSANPSLVKAFSQEETIRTQVQPRFAREDANHDGFLDWAELQQVTAAADWAGRHRDARLMDFDGDGQLSPAEYFALASIAQAAGRAGVPDPLAEACARDDAAIAAHFTDAQATLSARQWREAFRQSWWGKSFPQFDGDADGRVTRDEAHRALRIAYGLEDVAGLPLRDDTGRVFNWKRLRVEYDADGDGRVARDIFVEKYWRGPDKNRETFAAIDANSDGALSMAEMTASPECWEDVIARFRKFDANLDARVTADELKTSAAGSEQPLVAGAIPAYDLDGDAALSYREFAGSPFGNLLLYWAQPRTDANLDGALDLAEFHPTKDWLFTGVSQHFFSRCDRDRSGRLEIGEWDFPVDYARLPANALVKLVDRDGDGQLSRAEIGTGEPAGKLLDPAHQELFAQLDADGDGRVAIDDAARMRTLALMAADEKNLRETVWPTFQPLDTDGNGGLSLTEWMKGAASDKQASRRQEFLICDYDGNGALSLSEYASCPGTASVSRRGPVPDPIVEACDQVQQTVVRKLGRLPSRQWLPAVLDALPGLNPRYLAGWDFHRDGQLTDVELRRGLDIVFGIVHPDGTMLRRRNGQVFHWRNLQANDPNRDDRLDQAEFAKAYRSGKYPDEARQRFLAADQDGNGTLSMGELADAEQFWMDVIAEFRRWDLNTDGRVDALELKTNAKSWEAVMAASAFPGYDQNQDNVLTFMEFRHLPLGNPLGNWNTLRKDADHDGRLSPAEYHQERTLVTSALSAHFFSRLDRNHDGLLGLDEANFIVDVSQVPVETAFAVLDVDHSGALSLSESTQQAGARPTDPSKVRTYEQRLMRIEDAFRATDSNRDNQVDRTEFSDPSAVLAAVAAGKPASSVQNRSKIPPPLDEEGWSSRMIGLVSLNALLLIGVGWYFLRPRHS